MALWHTWGSVRLSGPCGRWGLVAQFPAPLWGALMLTPIQRPVRGASNPHAPARTMRPPYSTVTDFARFLGLSMSRPSAFAVW